MSISDNLKNKINRDASFRCGYCRVPIDLIYAEPEIDHLQPKSKGGADVEENLWLSCPRCNAFKHDKTHALDAATGEAVLLFNPRNQQWSGHFGWKTDDLAIIVGKTPCGRATIEALKMNFPASVNFRRFLVTHGRYPPDDEIL